MEKQDRLLHAHFDPQTDRRKDTHTDRGRMIERGSSGMTYFGVTADGVFPVTMAFVNAVRPPRPLGAGQVARRTKETRLTIAEPEDPVAVTRSTRLRAFDVTPNSVIT